MEVIAFNNMVWDLLRDISINMDAIFQPVYNKYELTSMQVRILEDIRRQEHTIGSLGRNLCIAVGNASAMCRKLEKEGYVKRLRDTSDERIVKVTLSEKGQSALLDIEECLQKTYYPLLKAELSENLDDIVKGLQKLNMILNKLSALDINKNGER